MTTIDYAKARAAMVEGQIRTNDVTDTRIHRAMGTLPRERFVPKSKRPLAYMGESVPLGDERYLMDPRAISKLLQALEVSEGDVALDIGCATGYSTAVLASMCDTVVGLDEDEALVSGADALLQDLGILNAAVVTGPLKAGVPDQGPYNIILVSGGVEIVPEQWTAQLADGGRMGVILLEGRIGRAHLYVNTGGVVSSRVVFDAVVPVLPGLTRTETFVF